MCGAVKKNACQGRHCTNCRQACHTSPTSRHMCSVLPRKATTTRAPAAGTNCNARHLYHQTFNSLFLYFVEAWSLDFTTNFLPLPPNPTPLRLSIYARLSTPWMVLGGSPSVLAIFADGSHSPRRKHNSYFSASIVLLLLRASVVMAWFCSGRSNTELVQRLRSANVITSERVKEVCAWRKPGLGTAEERG